MQLEFPFAEPYIQKAFELRQGYMRMWEQIQSFVPDKPSIYDIFQESIMMDDGPSIPITVVVGQKNQYDFPFSKVLYQQCWPDAEIRMSVED